jgi:hypothetical protein
VHSELNGVLIKFFRTSVGFTGAPRERRETTTQPKIQRSLLLLDLDAPSTVLAGPAPNIGRRSP